MIAAPGTLADAGPLFALVDPKGQPEQNARCRSTLAVLPAPLVTTWPAFTEAMYLAGRDGNTARQRLLAKFVTSGRLVIADQRTAEFGRMEALMQQYADRPMDLADASLVVAAEMMGATRIFTVDSDFFVYRLADGRFLDVTPGPLTSTDQQSAAR